MKLHTYYYNCSPEYFHSIDPRLHVEVESIIRMLPTRKNNQKSMQTFFLAVHLERLVLRLHTDRI
jgi:hypothetical protein